MSEHILPIYLIRCIYLFYYVGSMQSIPQNVLERYFEITEIFEMGTYANAINI